MKKDADGSYSPAKGFLTELLKTSPEFQPHSILNEGLVRTSDAMIDCNHHHHDAASRLRCYRMGSVT